MCHALCIAAHFDTHRVPFHLYCLSQCNQKSFTPGWRAEIGGRTVFVSEYKFVEHTEVCLCAVTMDLNLYMLLCHKHHPLYTGRRGCNSFNALHKYEECGFCYIDCAKVHQFNFSFKNLSHTLTDGHSMWVDLKTLPHVSVFSTDIFV